jgi:ABC-type sugar transport system ATPase subunit
VGRVGTRVDAHSAHVENEDHTPGMVVLEARHLEKSFPGVRAVDDVSLRLIEAEVHGLVGENGAGKSTLVKMLSGAYVPDAGELFMGGDPVRINSPVAARARGIAAIYQEPHIVPALSPVANVFLGQERARHGMRDERSMRRRFVELAEELGISLPTSGPAERLSIGAQQSLEIMRALERDARVIIMDEPTAALANDEIQALYQAIDVVLSRGAAVLLISHKLEEVLQLSSTVTVMRDGRKVASTRASETDVDGLVAAMLGERFEGALARARDGHRRSVPPAGPSRLAVTGLNLPGRLHDVHLEVRRGEIVGLAGLVGAGRTSLLRSLAGLEPAATGELALDGCVTRWPSTPQRARSLGIALAPEDRRRQGLALGRRGAENVVLSSLRSVGTFGMARRGTVVDAADTTSAQLGFARQRLLAPAGTLSGGNQQKLVLAKCVRTAPRVLLVDEPARGIDVGAKAEIFALLQDLSERGMAMVVVSEDIEELVAFVHRMVVLCRGRVTAEFDAEHATPDALGRAMFPVAAS